MTPIANRALLNNQPRNRQKKHVNANLYSYVKFTEVHEL
jgi:hypothetical protein